MCLYVYVSVKLTSFTQLCLTLYGPMSCSMPGIFHAKMGWIKDRTGMEQEKQKILRRGGKNTQKNCTKKIFMTQIIMMVWSLPRARHPGMWNQVGFKKHCYEQSQWTWWNSSWAIKNAERWRCESAALNMQANLENSSGHRTGKGQFSFQSQRKAMSKNAQTTTQLHSSHTPVK